CQNYISSPLTF
nr:immunoglobulin light chain junction region [Macaca mulatta]MOW61875.1 immunoglobulin light chain junction region [Macaca mulatta]MOW61938.1 immunoglobulin light chain junction region [Macaca mulatta]MOW62600.1 immunoglobulin light chain junction region [Macaca mulatta]MOW63431.1 immunoglobulin light chain junction region [Macaca mulatta]